MADGGDDFEGRADTFEGAAEDAWKKAKDHGKEPGVYKVKHIFVRTENPIREYRVTIGPGD